jgi:hypothetical protein
MARILARACSTEYGLGNHRKYDIEIPQDPKKIAPNMAPKQTPMVDVMRHHYTRFAPHLWATETRENAEEDEADDLALELDEMPEELEEDEDDDELGEEFDEEF